MARTRSTPSARREAHEHHFEQEALFEFSKVVNSSTDLSFVLGHVLLTIMGKMLSSRGMAILVRERTTGVVEMVKGFPQELRGTQFGLTSVPRSLFDLERLDRRRYPWATRLRNAGVSILLPMRTTAGLVGLLGFGGRLSKRRLPLQERTYFQSLANIAATAVEKNHTIEQLREVNRKLDRKIQELNTLFDLGKEFGALLDADKLVRLFVFSLLGQIGVNRYLVCLRQGADMKVVASRLDGPVPHGELLGALTRVTSPALIAGLGIRGAPRSGGRGGEAREALTSLGMQVVVPIVLQGDVRGVILLGEKLSREPFTQADLEFLSSLANLAVISLENARLFAEAIEKQRLEDELLIAREIQKGLLPSVLPRIPGFDLAATNISSKQVGGDYYDAIQEQRRGFVLAIGDVSGKGTPASLLMANLQATIRALVPLELSLGELTGRVNDLMCHNTGGNKFITFFWCELDPVGRRLTYVNAGHNYPFLLHADGSLDRLDRGGMILGVMKTALPYEQATVGLQPGDLLVLFTDGVSEAMSRESEEYGEARLEALLRTRAHQPAQEIMEAIHEDIRQFASGTQQSDDLTMMILKVC